MPSGTDVSIIAVAIAMLIFFSGAEEEEMGVQAPAAPAPPPPEDTAATDWVRHIADQIIGDGEIPTDSTPRAPGALQRNTRLLQATGNAAFEQAPGGLNEVEGRRRA